MHEQQWWYWAFGAVIAVALEVGFGTSFVFIFFAAAAAVTSLAVALHLTAHLWQAASLFAALSCAMVGLVRKPLLGRSDRRGKKHDIDGMVGNTAVVQSAMEPGGRGQVGLQGTTWMARNCGAQSLPAGMTCRVVSVHNLTLYVDGDGKDY